MKKQHVQTTCFGILAIVAVVMVLQQGKDILAPIIAA